MKKFTALAIVWVAIIVIYLFMAVAMPAVVEITEESSAGMHASACMTEFPGTVEAVESAPVWMWFIPGLVGIVTTVIILKRAD